MQYNINMIYKYIYIYNIYIFIHTYIYLFTYVHTHRHTYIYIHIHHGIFHGIQWDLGIFLRTFHIQIKRLSASTSGKQDGIDRLGALRRSPAVLKVWLFDRLTQKTLVGYTRQLISFAMKNHHFYSIGQTKWRLYWEHHVTNYINGASSRKPWSWLPEGI